MSGGRKPNVKGNKYEADTVAWYEKHGFRAERTKRAQGRRRGGTDVALLDAPGFHVECKHYSQGGLVFRAHKQAANECDDGSWPVVHVHCDNGAHLVAIDRELWAECLRRMT